MGFYNTFHNINEHTDKIKVIASSVNSGNV